MTRSLISLALASGLLIAAPPAFAQDSAADAQRRLDRIERELRAVQRRVFPGGESTLIQPDVTPADPGAVTPASPTPSPISDLTGRIDAIEAQLARLTGEIEQTGFRQQQIDAAVSALRAELVARLDRIDPPVAAEPLGAESTESLAVPANTAAPASPAPSSTQPAPGPATTNDAGSGSSTGAITAARRIQVAAVEVPATGDAPEDAYIYGFRLWSARLFPEAQLQLQKVIEEYPDHRRASFAGNLLGRAYLDNNQPALAVRAFYDNYRSRPRGERAAESVYYMGMALIRLDRAPDACRTFAEFDRNYGASASAALRAQVTAARGQARC